MENIYTRNARYFIWGGEINGKHFRSKKFI